jgi:hypothetical protein
MLLPNVTAKTLISAVRGMLVGLILLLSLLPVSELRADPALTKLKPDVRLLIDISGSMKTSDPENLRVPAVELIVRLLPNGARAGIWLFGEDVQILVEHRVVDDSWREQALQAVADIDSSGLRTNIPAALEAATYDLEQMNPGYRTSIVLLTDGKVDLSESPMANATAARNLLSDKAPELGAIGIPVHVIALSVEADWKFLRSLAQLTGGMAEKAESPAELSSIYLRNLESAAPMERVPVNRRSFTIDDSVNEFTALMFHSHVDTAKVALVAPDGTQYRPEEPAQGVEWFISGQFAMVTFSAPPAGEYRFEAPAGASLRVSVISDLHIDLDPPPGSLPTGKRAELGLRLRDKGEVITDPEILGLFAFTLEIHDPDGQKKVINISSRYELPEDGEYRVRVPAMDKAGRYQLMIRLKSETVRRKLPIYIDVYSPAGAGGITTRPGGYKENSLLIPGIIMAVLVFLVVIVALFIRRRRARRRLALWQERARDPDSAITGEFVISGLSAEQDQRDSPP